MWDMVLKNKGAGKNMGGVGEGKKHDQNALCEKYLTGTRNSSEEKKTKTHNQQIKLDCVWAQLKNSGSSGSQNRRASYIL